MNERKINNNLMKHKVSMILTAVIILSVLTGCGTVGKQSSTIAENEEGTVWTVRIKNRSAVNLYGIAASYSANGETLGSKACDRIEGEADQLVYAFSFVPDELPAAPIDTFRLDVFAAEKASEDYSDCGSVVIKRPQPGVVYTLTLNGEEAAALTLSTTERDVDIFASTACGSIQKQEYTGGDTSIGGLFWDILHGERGDGDPTAEDAEISIPTQTDLSLDSLVGPWHLADDTDLETLSEIFPGAAEFGSSMEVRSDGRISWHIGADGAMGTYFIEGGTLAADVTGELDGEAYRITLRQPEPEKLTMTFKEVELVWTYGEGDSLRGED